MDDLELEELIHLLAKARYVQEVETAIIQNGVAGAFANEDE